MSLIPAGFGSSAAAGWNGGAFTAVALAPDGTVQAPAYAFASNASSGLFLPLVNQPAIAISGFTAVNWQKTGANTVQQFNRDQGVATIPSYSFFDDQNTGMYHPGSGRLGFTAGGVAQLEVNTSGVSMSMTTQANSSGMTTRQLRLVFAASGISLIYSSGKSEYVIGQSAQSGAQS